MLKIQINKPKITSERPRLFSQSVRTITLRPERRSFSPEEPSRPPLSPLVLVGCEDHRCSLRASHLTTRLITWLSKKHFPATWLVIGSSAGVSTCPGAGPR